MTETYPSDQTLLSLLTDEQTGVEYIPTGQSPYYLHFRKLLYRLLLATGRANDLRVFNAGDLDIGIKPGAFWLGNQLIEYAGTPAVTLTDDKPQIFIYLDNAGQLVTDQYDAFPLMTQQKHIRLAIVTTSAGQVESILDCRGQHLFSIPPSAGITAKTIENHQQDASLQMYESGSIHTNRTASQNVTLSLPAEPQPGIELTFAVQASYELRIDPGAAAIRDSSGNEPGKYKSSAQLGAALTVTADQQGDWIVTAKTGTWTQQP